MVVVEDFRRPKKLRLIVANGAARKPHGELQRNRADSPGTSSPGNEAAASSLSHDSHALVVVR